MRSYGIIHPLMVIPPRYAVSDVIGKIKQYEKEYNFTSGANDDIDKAKAKSMLTGRLKYLADKHGFTYNRVFIKISTEYPSACWRDESGSPIGEAKVFALNG